MNFLVVYCQTLRYWTMMGTPFLVFYLVGMVFQLSILYLFKLAIFTALYCIIYGISKILYDERLMTVMPMAVYLATKVIIYTLIFIVFFYFYSKIAPNNPSYYVQIVIMLFSHGIYTVCAYNIHSYNCNYISGYHNDILTLGCIQNGAWEKHSYGNFFICLFHDSFGVMWPGCCIFMSTLDLVWLYSSWLPHYSCGTTFCVHGGEIPVLLQLTRHRNTRWERKKTQTLNSLYIFFFTSSLTKYESLMLYMIPSNE